MSTKITSKLKVNKRWRPGKGFSLVTVTLIGLIATMWLTATLASVVPAIQAASQNRTVASARAAAESAADWAVDSLNGAVLDSSLYPSPLDAIKSSFTTTPVPPAVLNNPLATATVTVRNVSPTSTSYIYDKTLAVSTGQGSYSTILSNGWRVIESTATVGGITRRVRTTIKPSYRPMATVRNPGMAYSLFGASSVNIQSNVQTDGYNSQLGYNSSHYTASQNSSAGLGGDIGSLSKVTLGTNVTIGGSVDVSLMPAGSSVKVASGQNSSVVNRYMNLNGTQDGSFFDNTQSKPNVLGYSNNSIGLSDDLTNGRAYSILERQGAAQPGLPPVPATPSMFTDATSTLQAVNLGALSVGNSSPTTIVVTSSAPPPPYSINQGTTNYIRPGNYTASSIDIGSNGQIIVSSNVASQPFRIFVDGTAPSTSAVNISGSNGIRNFSTPSSVQIYYNGSKNVNLASTRGLSAIVYAPNALLNMAPNSSNKVNYYGSFVGDTINAKNAYIHFDSALKSGSYMDSLANGNSYGPNTSKSQPLFVYKTVTWQEF